MEASEKKIRIQGKETEVYAEHPIRVACLEHVEREIDDYVDRYEVAPDTFKLEEIDDATVPKTCMVCGAEGKIALLHVKGM